MDALSLLREREPVIKKRFGVAKIGIFGSSYAERRGLTAT